VRAAIAAAGNLSRLLIRFRPIMMTTMAAMLGAVPIVLGYRRRRRSPFHLRRKGKKIPHTAAPVVG
jgi:multidrug efflux pump subunit AcrB